VAVCEPTAFRGSERFELLECLGTGGMGVVYRARDHERGEEIALKTIKNFDAKTLALFKHEFRAIADLVHPNLVRLGELYEEAGQWFFTMELLRGQSFLSFVRRSEVGSEDPTPSGATGLADESPSFVSPRTPLHTYDEARLRASLKQLAQAVHALHLANKLHRDIKPSNVLVTPEERVVLLDFGLVAAFGQELPETGLIGTARYMAPEQALSAGVGPAADWYSVGVVLYEALTGQAPFVGTTSQILAHKVRYEPPTPKVSASRVPDDLSDLCVNLLRLDPTARPKGQEILSLLGVDSPAVAGPSVSTHGESAPFVGRGQELAKLETALADSRRESVMVFVHGESGLGKTSLVRHFVEHAEEAHQGALILCGRCFERESVPYKAFDGIVDALAERLARMDQVEVAYLATPKVAALVRLFPTLRRAAAIGRAPELNLPDPQELRSRAFTALRTLLANLAETRPVVLCIDDFQWTDADSLSLMREILRPPDPPRLLLVCTVQSGAALPDTDPVALATRWMPGVRHIQLERLGAEDARTLAKSLLSAGGQATALVEEAAGHPLFLHELSRYAAHADPSELRTAKLDDILWARIADLTDEAKRLLHVVAIACGPIERSAAASAASLDRTPFARSLGELRAEHLVRAVPWRGVEHIEIYHAKTRKAVVAHLGAEEQKALHRELASALVGTGHAEPEALTVHFREAGEPLTAASYAVKAADKACEKLAFGRAADLYRTALDLGQHDPKREREIRLQLAGALARAGRGAEAARQYLAAVPGALSGQALELQRMAAEQYLRSGHIDEGIETARTVLASVGLALPETPRRALLSLILGRVRLRLRGMRFRQRDASQVSAEALARIDLCWAISYALGWADNIRGADFQTRALRYALDAGEPLRLVRTLVGEGSYLATQGLPALKRTRELAARANQLSQSLHNSEANAWAVGLGSFVAYCMGQWKEAEAIARSTEKQLLEEFTDMTWEIDTVKIVSAWSLYYLGELGELVRRVSLFLGEAEDRGDLHAATNLRIMTLNSAWLVGDDPDRARAEAQQALQSWSVRSFQLQHFWGLYAQAQVDLYQGDGRAVLARLEPAWPSLKRSFLLRIQIIRIEALELRARAMLACALRTDKGRDDLLSRAAKGARRIRREKTAYGNALATLLEAGIARARAKDAAPLYARAALEFQACDMALHAAVARLRQGEASSPDEGRATIAAALYWMSQETVKNPAAWANMLAPAGDLGPGIPDTAIALDTRRAIQ
jgi:serine/threonine protein kinase